MKILQIAPIIERVPPKKYGGTERVIHALTEELVKRGHDVTLMASGDSLTSAKLISVTPQPLREAKIDDIYGLNPLTLLNIGQAYKDASEFDIIHDHNAPVSIPFAYFSNTPVIITLHGSFTVMSMKLFEAFKDANYVTISNAQMKSLPNLNYIGTVYNGLSMEEYPFSEDNDGYLLFVGRITPEKGVHEAIKVAKFLDLPLIIAAKYEPDLYGDYFNQKIKPHLYHKIQMLGEIDADKRNQLMSKALCMLHPINWREPFGLTLIEAMACGCPVIGFNRGSVAEIVKDGKTGYVVEDTEEMIQAVKNIEKIKRENCRNYVLKNFNVQKMTDGYEEIYLSIIKGKKQKNLLNIKNNGNGSSKNKITQNIKADSV